jgi:hypothetical protein
MINDFIVFRCSRLFEKHYVQQSNNNSKQPPSWKKAL